MYGKELLPLVQANSRADRFSLNLLKWIRKHKELPLFVAFSSDDGSVFDYSKTLPPFLYIGIGDLDQGFLHGSRLSEILCLGARTRSWAYQPKMNFQIIPDWWAHYIEGGKCCIDPEHVLYADKERWDMNGKIRTCIWCGNHKQIKHVKRVTQAVWRPFVETTSA